MSLLTRLLKKQSFITKHQEIFAAVGERIAGRIEHSSISGPCLIGCYLEIPYKIYIMPGSQYSAPDLRIEFTGKLPYTLTLQAEGLNSKLERLIGFGKGKNIRTGIEEFDRKYAVRTTDPEKALAYFHKPEIRKTLDEISDSGSFLFRGKYAEIIIPITPQKMSLRIRHASEYIDPDKVVELLHKGAFLIQALQESSEPFHGSGSREV